MLIITIIIIIILAATIIVSLAKNNIIEKAKEAEFKSYLVNVNEELSLNIINMYTNSIKKEDVSINANVTNLSINGEKQEGKNIFNIIPSLKDSGYENLIHVTNNKLEMYSLNNHNKEKLWFKEVTNRETKMYVQRGLVLQIDGIWNDGSTIHNYSTNIWRDLSGNDNDFELKNFTQDENNGWTSNGLKINAGKGNLISKKEFKLNPFNESTIELNISDDYNITQWCNMINVNGVSYDEYRAGGGYRVLRIGRNGSIDSSHLNLNIDSSYGLFSFVTSFKDNIGYYKNLSKNATANLKKVESYDYTPQKITIFNNYIYTSGIIYSLRIYDRQLIPEEIEYNRKLDIERFS